MNTTKFTTTPIQVIINETMHKMINNLFVLLNAFLFIKLTSIIIAFTTFVTIKSNSIITITFANLNVLPPNAAILDIESSNFNPLNTIAAMAYTLGLNFLKQQKKGIKPINLFKNIFLI